MYQHPLSRLANLQLNLLSYAVSKVSYDKRMTFMSSLVIPSVQTRSGQRANRQTLMWTMCSLSLTHTHTHILMLHADSCQQNVNACIYIYMCVCVAG